MNGGCIPLLLLEGRAHLPGFSPGQGQVAKEALARTMGKTEPWYSAAAMMPQTENWRLYIPDEYIQIDDPVAVFGS